MTIKQLKAKIANYDYNAVVKIIIEHENTFIVKDVKLVNINKNTVYIYATEEEGNTWTKRQLN